MDRNRSPSGWRAAAFAAALFAITLNFLQPLAHAALMREGAPLTLWGGFCDASAADPDARSDAGKSSTPARVDAHACCLGLAHATVLAAPPTAFSIVERVLAIARPLPAVEQLTPVGIRDGPTQPRGPPSFA